MRARPLRPVIVTGLVATIVAMALTTLAAALAQALGVDFEVVEGDPIPLSGIAFVTGVFSAVGVGIAAALHRWSARPAERFLAVTVPLTAISLLPPLLSEAEVATVVSLVGLHLVAAALMIPALARRLRTPDAAGGAPEPRSLQQQR